MRLFRKLRRIWDSDLAGPDVLWYLLGEVLERTGMQTAERSYRLRDGSTVFLRQGTTDCKVFDEVFIEQIYAPFVEAAGKPRILVDLGANVGLSTLFLDRRIGFDHVIAVEPDFGNLQALRRNLDDNLHVPCESIQAFAGAARGFAKVMDEGYGAWGLRMGDAAPSGIPVLPLADILPNVPGGALLKCDIEGAEQHLFPQIDRWDHLVNFIILELHTEFFPIERLHSALATSRYEWRFHGGAEPGAVLAVFGLERGALRPTLQSAPLHLEGDSRNYSRGAAAV
jgi:FkbM family methyltransferase